MSVVPVRCWLLLWKGVSVRGESAGLEGLGVGKKSQELLISLLDNPVPRPRGLRACSWAARAHPLPDPTRPVSFSQAAPRFWPSLPSHRYSPTGSAKGGSELSHWCVLRTLVLSLPEGGFLVVAELVTPGGKVADLLHGGIKLMFASPQPMR